MPFVLRLVLRLRHDGCRGRLLQGAARHFYLILKSMLDQLGIQFADGLGITWASLRARGASHRYQSGQHASDIMWLGRWQIMRILELCRGVSGCHHPARASPHHAGQGQIVGLAG